MTELVATATITIDVPRKRVWQALDDEARRHSEENWRQMLATLKNHLENESRVESGQPSVRNR